jgi:hypothetical protein
MEDLYIGGDVLSIYMPRASPATAAIKKIKARFLRKKTNRTKAKNN